MAQARATLRLLDLSCVSSAVCARDMFQGFMRKRCRVPLRRSSCFSSTFCDPHAGPCSPIEQLARWCEDNRSCASEPGDRIGGARMSSRPSIREAWGSKKRSDSAERSMTNGSPPGHSQTSRTLQLWNGAKRPRPIARELETAGGAPCGHLPRSQQAGDGFVQWRKAIPLEEPASEYRGAHPEAQLRQAPAIGASAPRAFCTCQVRPAGGLSGFREGWERNASFKLCDYGQALATWCCAFIYSRESLEGVCIKCLGSDLTARSAHS